jgi:S1-C subfamily serine protease
VSSLSSLSQEIAAVVSAAAASVVPVHGRSRFNSSGVHWAPGLVVTAAHTIRREGDVELSNGVDAEIAGVDPGVDLAVLRASGLNVPVASQRRDSALHAGELIFSIGRNKDRVNAGMGVVGSVDGPSTTWRGGKLDRVIRAALDLHAVAAGGSIIDASGRLIGIATPVLSRTSVFAVPVETVDRLVQTIATHGRVPQGYLGLGLQPVPIPESLRNKHGLAASTALMTVSVDEESPAGAAGMLIGDILYELDGHAVERPDAVRRLLSESIGKQVSLRILRGGEAVALQATVADRHGRKA